MTSQSLGAALQGEQVGDYRLINHIGGGHFGVVFEAENVNTGSRFAIKVLPPTSDTEASSDFDSEGLLLKKLSRCSSVVNWIETDVAIRQMAFQGGSFPIPIKFHALALASGSLEELVNDPATRNSMPWAERVSHWRGAIKGVHQMHLNQVAHRDLKASNCLLMVSGGQTELRLADLGRSKDFSQLPTLPPVAYLSGRGDLRFAPPEFLWLQGGSTGQDFRNADLYGLGSLLVELTTGHPMTALAIGSWQDARKDGEKDYLSGRQRDLGVLRPQFRRAIKELSEEVPPIIRHDTVSLLEQLCDPVPEQRQPRRALNKRFVSSGGLEWLLRRADILSRRLAVESRRPKHKGHKNRTAS
ncbi:protein kinase [Nocardioides sp.]|uniref:protein kinase domain-containing protein n=1 Tax=Nocardioides sp. TaxID=35761 RepID=UPI00351139D7